MTLLAIEKMLSPQDLEKITKQLSDIKEKRKQCEEDWAKRPKDYDLYVALISTSGLALIHKCGTRIPADDEGQPQDEKCYECGESLQNAITYQKDVYDIIDYEEEKLILDELTVEAYKTQIAKSQTKLDIF